MTEARLLAELTANSDGQLDPSGHCKTSSQGSEESGESANSPGRKRSLAAPPKLNLVPPITLPVEFPTPDEAASIAASTGLEAGAVQELWSVFTKSALHMVESFQAAKYDQVSHLINIRKRTPANQRHIVRAGSTRLLQRERQQCQFSVDTRDASNSIPAAQSIRKYLRLLHHLAPRQGSQSSRRRSFITAAILTIETASRDC